MTIPKLKRVKVASEQELRTWLNKNSGQAQDVMIVTCNKKSHQKYIARDQLYDAVVLSGWTAGRRYTLDGNLVGQVISPSRVKTRSEG
ncbi:MAG: hypothetical protein ACRBCL_07510 [Maritimibacter sp.]